LLHYKEKSVLDLLFQGNFGLEKESLRILEDGTMAHTAPVDDQNHHVVRDFCENQTEINTDVYPTGQQALQSLYKHEMKIQEELAARSPREYLWPFSNPGYIKDEEDIPVAQFYGEQEEKTRYRHYLAAKYGKYKMTFSGIHYNFSFDSRLIEADFACSKYEDMQEYKNALYLNLAKNAVQYGFLITMLTAASPIVDSSYFEKGVLGQSEFIGLASIRSSELGYWNAFTPIFDYANLNSYIQSIQNYIDQGFIERASELYYPIRLKPVGENQLENFKNGISHIELRMLDLNPLSDYGLEEMDVQFIHLFLIWLACLDSEHQLDASLQIQAVQDFKNASHYDLKTVRTPSGSVNKDNISLIKKAKILLMDIEAFYASLSLSKEQQEQIQTNLAFQKNKLENADARYAWQIRRQYKSNFVAQGIALAKKKQQQALFNLSGKEIAS
jgi:glutamate--cysteine ligase